MLYDSLIAILVCTEVAFHFCTILSMKLFEIAPLQFIPGSFFGWSFRSFGVVFSPFCIFSYLLFTLL